MNEEKTVVMYLVKYWETAGIQEKEVKTLMEQGEMKYARIIKPLSHSFGLFVIGKDIFHTKEQAIAQVTKLRDRKIEATKKKLNKLQSMDITKIELLK